MSKRGKKKYPKIGKRTVHSDFEYEIYLRMCEILPKHNVEYEPEKLPYSTNHEYIPDFRIVTKSGKTIYIETKGNGRSFDGSVRQKMIAARDQNPDKDIRILFYSEGKCGPTKKNGTFMRQSKRANKNDFTYAIRHLPKEWLEE